MIEKNVVVNNDAGEQVVTYAEYKKNLINLCFSENAKLCNHFVSFVWVFFK